MNDVVPSPDERGTRNVPTRWVVAAAVGAAVIALSGCRQAPKIRLPGDFVEVGLAPGAGYETHAKSRDGIVVTLRRHRNIPGETLAFWVQAVTTEMVEGRAYELLSSHPVASDTGVPGRMLTFTVRTSDVDYTYLLAVYVNDRQALIAEAGGASIVLNRRLSEIKRALFTVR